MFSWFSSKPKITAQDRAILDMKTQRDKLRQYQKRIQNVTARETAIAKDLLAAGQKDKALLALRRKKYQESLLTQTDQQLEQLEKLTSSVEFALVQKDVLFGLERGTQVLKQINKEMGGIEGVERLMGEGADARREQEEISQALAGQLSNSEEDEVEDELDALEREVLGVPQMPDAPINITSQTLPDVPTSQLDKAAQQRQRARERKAELQAA